MKLNDAVVLVTGANRGLGRALVEASLAAGARRVYAGARDPRSLEAARDDRVVPLAIDITEARSLAAAAAQAGDVAILINNAGVLAAYDVLTASDADLARDFGVNAFGTLAATKAFLPALERAGARGPAAVVNVLSVVSLASMPGLGGYSAAKAASLSITQSLRAGLAPRNIAVHAVLAGAIDTDMVRAFEMPKTSAAAVARGIIEGVEADQEEIAPDPMSRELFATWQREPKALERRLAAMSG